jgi:alkyl sulfatase BDS1-like metallo-beta-lactamase superfamily hydrolase
MTAHPTLPISADMLSLLPLARFLELLAIRIDGHKAQDLQIRFNWTLSEGDGSTQQQRLTLSHGALSHLPGHHEGAIDGHIVTPRAQLARLLTEPQGLMQAIDDGSVQVHGRVDLLRAFAQTLEIFSPMFSIAEP